ncbi:MAG: glycoside hydrolase family 2 protein [Ruminococcaceae bacterium]|nr:glycoside hydrolase family 2 protein [Oscillospiraceae bacterium]
MRQITSINNKWFFRKGVSVPPEKTDNSWCIVNLPHTYNAIDGQDGQNDYYRGFACYQKEMSRSDLPGAERHFLEIRGANSSAEVFVNGVSVKKHDGGYSTFRVDITDRIKDSFIISVVADNSANDRVYPQMADFTFYGGLYRSVNIISVAESHFDLEYYGAPGIEVTPEVSREKADVKLIAHVKHGEGTTVRFHLIDGEGNPVATADADEKTNSALITLEAPHLWQGRNDPYLYTARAELIKNGEVIDEVSTRFGCRFFEITADRGFILNGEEYPLRGVSRHQDRWSLGNALLPEHHREDIELICEVGANTVRLAHYQHDEYFYDLCDEKGLLVWAEIPYISQHLPNARENTVSQMKELIAQNYNHPSIFVWGLSNEISMKGDKDPDMLENHRILNSLCHEMDKTRPTTIAVLSPCPTDSPYIKIPDTVAYNHYFGWYGGDTSMNGPWFDKFHKEHPDIPIACSEYGCEGLDWHTSTPHQGDYTEEYQAYYHEELIKQLFARKYLWATYVWNMFDFGADARNEGGENGQNHKGLITFDRKYKKDAFYAYKAHLSKEPFVHICGKRYAEREGDTIRLTVYSNLPEVELYVNKTLFEKKKAEDRFFRFEVPNNGTTLITALSEGYMDECVFRKVEQFNEKYRLKETGAVLNWFDVREVDGRLSLNSKISDIVKTGRGKEIFDDLMRASLAANKEDNSLSHAAMKSEGMMEMLGSFTLLRMLNMASGMLGFELDKKQLLSLNENLNEVEL